MQLSAQSPERAAEPALSTHTSSTKTVAERHFFKFLLVLLLVAGTAYASISYTRFKFARSEIAYAEISKEMLAANSFIVPLYRNTACIDKPVLNYWAIIPSFKVFGVNDFSARIPALLASLSCLAIFALAIRRIWGADVSLLSTLVLATTSRYWEFSTLCMTDMFLTLFDMVALIAMYVGLKSESKRFASFALAAVSMGLAVLTKGPVGLILPAFAFFVYLVLTGNLKILKIGQVIACVVIFFAVAGPWYVAAAAAVDTSSNIGAWLWHHNVERFFGSAYECHNDPFYMVGAFFNGFAPWCALVPIAFADSVRRWLKKSDPEESKTELYLWIWLLLTTAFFTLSRGKMNYYDLPAFPAAAGIVGLHLNRWINESNAIAKGYAWLFSITLILGGFVAGYLLPGVTNNEDFSAWCMMPIGLLLTGGAAIVALKRKHYFAPYVLCSAGIAVTLLSFAIQVHPAMALQAPGLQYIQTIKEHPDTKIALHKDFGTTVDWFDVTLFHTDRVPTQLDNGEQMTEFLLQKDPVYVIVPENRFDELPDAVRQKVTVIANKPYMYEKNDVGFLFRRKGHLMGKVHLLLVTNMSKEQSDKTASR
ncbi:MAG: glycosyltransferase family 39 protein [Cyanobacteria bacterium SZAS LIN-5]|nr:glycosyltransferase family 39 protein [Cyanobacteria bacterium SZAS LIN-5]RTL42670.1 MAG: glycosyltransferase family 39 protein [Candidatus Melainabacteria bacterium]